MVGYSRIAEDLEAWESVDEDLEVTGTKWEVV